MGHSVKLIPTRNESDVQDPHSCEQKEIVPLTLQIYRYGRLLDVWYCWLRATDIIRTLVTPSIPAEGVARVQLCMQSISRVNCVF